MQSAPGTFLIVNARDSSSSQCTLQADKVDARHIKSPKPPQHMLFRPVLNLHLGCVKCTNAWCSPSMVWHDPHHISYLEPKYDHWSRPITRTWLLTKTQMSSLPEAASTMPAE